MINQQDQIFNYIEQFFEKFIGKQDFDNIIRSHWINFKQILGEDPLSNFKCYKYLQSLKSTVVPLKFQPEKKISVDRFSLDLSQNPNFKQTIDGFLQYSVSTQNKLDSNLDQIKPKHFENFNKQDKEIIQEFQDYKEYKEKDIIKELKDIKQEYKIEKILDFQMEPNKNQEIKQDLNQEIMQEKKQDFIQEQKQELEHKEHDYLKNSGSNQSNKEENEEMLADINQLDELYKKNNTNLRYLYRQKNYEFSPLEIQIQQQKILNFYK